MGIPLRRGSRIASRGNALTDPCRWRQRGFTKILLMPIGINRRLLGPLALHGQRCHPNFKPEDLRSLRSAFGGICTIALVATANMVVRSDPEGYCSSTSLHRAAIVVTSGLENRNMSPILCHLLIFQQVHAEPHTCSSKQTVGDGGQWTNAYPSSSGKDWWLNMDWGSN